MYSFKGALLESDNSSGPHTLIVHRPTAETHVLVFICVQAWPMVEVLGCFT